MIVYSVHDKEYFRTMKEAMESAQRRVTEYATALDDGLEVLKHEVGKMPKDQLVLCLLNDEDWCAVTTILGTWKKTIDGEVKFYKGIDMYGKPAEDLSEVV